jgi:hypothetical protein
MPTQPLDVLPIWAMYLLIVLLGLLVVEAGFRLGRYWKKRTGQAKQDNVNSLVGATLALLAFLLVFMIGIASNRFDNRRQLVVAEANAIGTAYLRAGYLDEPDRTDIRNLLREYVDVRLEAAADDAKIPQARARSEAIHTEMWTRAEAMARAHPDSDMGAIFIESLNAVIDLHTERIVAVFNRIPINIWLAIFFVAFLTLAMVGFSNGLGDSRNFFAQLALILVFSAVILLIVDLDRPGEGFLQVSQQPLIDLQQQLHSTAP